MELELQEVAEILGSRLPGAAGRCRSYGTDSRQIEPGRLFFAVRGPNFDGHDFVEEAHRKGAVGAVVVAKRFSQYPKSLRPFLLVVEDTVRALQQLGRAVRRRWGGPLVAVTGSAGKTTTKEMVAAVLTARFRVAKSEGNLNNEFGLPLSLLHLDAAHEVAVMELGMSHAGEIRALAALAEPNLAVFTNVAPVHLEFFDSLDAIARAKYELVEETDPKGTLVLNSDDERVSKFAEGFAGRVVTYGVVRDGEVTNRLKSKADVRAENLRAGRDGGTEFDLVIQRKCATISLQLPGEHNVRNALAAAAVAQAFDLPTDRTAAALGGFQAFAQRSEVLRLDNGVTLINDSYNSNPQALEEMLKVLGSWPTEGRRILVAGEMLELGTTAPELHRELGAKAVRWGQVDWLLGVGNHAKSFLEGARQEGMDGDRMKFFETAEEAGEFAAALVKAGDTVLMKGSRGVRLEKALERFCAVKAGTAGR